MPSLVVDYVAGSGFVPMCSGYPWSGRANIPIGGIQIRADRNNSGNVYVSLSGAYVFSGVVMCLPASGGPTITSGAMRLSGGMNSGRNDAMQLGPGDAYFPPRSALAVSGTCQICFGCDPACSGGFARVYIELI